MHRTLYFMVVLVMLGACTSKLPRQSDLDRPRILAVHLDKPTLRPGEFAQAELLLYDPFWREPTIHWALYLSPLSLDQLRTDYPDPTTLTPELGFLYLGQGPRVITPPYPLNATAEAALVEAGVEQLSLPLVAFVDIAGFPDRLIGFKQVRLQVTAATVSYLEQQEGWSDLTSVEQQRQISRRIELVYNQNPVAVTVQVGTRDQALSVDDRNDLVKRKALDFNFGSLSVAPGGIVRASLPMTDPDNSIDGKALVRDDEGYNVLQTSVYMELAQRTNVDPFTSDFGMDVLEQQSAADEPRFIPVERGIYVGHMVGIDRRGGVLWRSFTVDVGSEPPASAQSLESTVLLRSGLVTYWQPVTESMAQAMADATAPVFLSGTLVLRSIEGEVSLDQDPRRSAGVPFALQSAQIVTNATELDRPEDWLNPPYLYENLGQPVTIAVEIVRPWP